MPPHCDSLDGPVAVAARHALDAQDVGLILPFVAMDGEAEVAQAFRRVLAVRGRDPLADDLLDRWFLETAVRVHRAGEGAPYTGLKPAGLDVGPIIPVAERAVESGDPAPLASLLLETLRHEIELRFADLETKRARREEGVPAARAYVSAMLGIQVWSHGLHQAIRSGAHGEDGAVGQQKAPPEVHAH